MDHMRTRVLILAALLATTLSVASCTSGGGPSPTDSPSTPGPRPASTAKLSIVSPTNGEVIHGGSVRLKVSLKGAKIVSPFSDSAETVLRAVRDAVPSADELGKRTLRPAELRARLG